MTENDPDQGARQPALPLVWPLLFLLFVGSGCAALIYEIVWLQLLQLVIGSSAVSLAVLLGTFMGGMCLGSIAAPRLVSARSHPLRVYALIEMGIAVMGSVLLYFLPQAARLYIASAGHGFSSILLRGLVCAVCLLPPTVLMGATLPVIARLMESTPAGVSRLGFFYGGNIAGAVIGCLGAGFYLLRVYDMSVATYAAAAINVFVALLSLLISAAVFHERPQPFPRDRMPGSPNPSDGRGGALAAGSFIVYVAIGLSGMCALAGEVVWTRVMSLFLGPTVYTFSIILGVFLVGLGAGSSFGSLLAKLTSRPRVAFAVCQLLAAGAIAWTAWMVARFLPFWPIDFSLVQSPWFSFQLDIVRCIWGILLPAFFWGASFPLALSAAAGPGQDPARLVARVYAANTVGAIIGAVLSSLFLIAWIGTGQVERWLIGVSAGTGAMLLLSARWPARTRDLQDQSISETRMHPASAAASLIFIGCLATLLVVNVPKIPGTLIAHGRQLAKNQNEGRVLFAGEGLNSSVAVTELGTGVRNFHVAGKIEASTEPQDMRLQRMLGHLPALLHRQPKSVLIVGCGAGVTSGSFIPHPGIDRITICEIEPLIPRVVATYFGKENYDVVKNPRVKIVYDDARHFILTTREKFDIITSDPIHPWVKGAATLYTKEYFELVKQHLNPGGMVTQWVPLYESNMGAVKSEVATFFDVFPNGTAWSNDEDGYGYDMVLLGQTGRLEISLEEVQERLKNTPEAAQSLSDVGFKSAISLFSTYAGQARDLQPWLRDAEMNRDRTLRPKYLAGMANNLSEAGRIHDSMIAYRRFPNEIFAGTDLRNDLLRLMMDRK